MNVASKNSWENNHKIEKITKQIHKLCAIIHFERQIFIKHS